MTLNNGITAETAQRILLGPGAVYIGDPNYGGTLLGATKGGNVLTIARTIKDFEPDGGRGRCKGFRKVDKVDASLSVKLMEVTEESVQMALAGAALAGHVITGGEIVSSTYIDLVTIVADIMGEEVPEATGIICKLSNCLVEGPFTLKLAEKAETVIELTFHAHFDPEDMTTEPWEIEFVPVEGS